MLKLNGLVKGINILHIAVPPIFKTSNPNKSWLILKKHKLPSCSNSSFALKPQSDV